MDKPAVIILESSAFFDRGQIIEDYELKDDGVLCENKFIPKENLIFITEDLSKADEERIRELIRQALSNLFKNIDRKSSTLLKY